MSMFRCEMCNEIILVRWHAVHFTRKWNDVTFVCTECYHNDCRKCSFCGKTFVPGRVYNIVGKRTCICRDCIDERDDDIRICINCHNAYEVDGGYSIVRWRLDGNLCKTCLRYLRTCRRCGDEFIGRTGQELERSVCHHCAQEMSRDASHEHRVPIPTFFNDRLPEIKFKRKDKNLTRIVDDPGSEM